MALNDKKNLITIEKAEKGKVYYCPLCGKEMVKHENNNTKFISKRPSFRHKDHITRCTPEVVLQYLAKSRIIEIFYNSLSINKPIDITWDCLICGEKHIDNLLNNTCLIRQKYFLGGFNPKERLLSRTKNRFSLPLNCMPDAFIFNNNNKLLKIIKVFVPTMFFIKKYYENYCERKDINLIEINVLTEDDFKNLDKKLLTPDKVNYCLDKKAEQENGRGPARQIL